MMYKIWFDARKAKWVVGISTAIPYFFRNIKGVEFSTYAEVAEYVQTTGLPEVYKSVKDMPAIGHKPVEQVKPNAEAIIERMREVLESDRQSTTG